MSDRRIFFARSAQIRHAILSRLLLFLLAVYPTFLYKWLIVRDLQASVREVSASLEGLNHAA
jgi:hypothetical protein